MATFDVKQLNSIKTTSNNPINVIRIGGNELGPLVYADYNTSVNLGMIGSSAYNADSRIVFRKINDYSYCVAVYNATDNFIDFIYFKYTPATSTWAANRLRVDINDGFGKDVNWCIDSSGILRYTRNWETKDMGSFTINSIAYHNAFGNYKFKCFYADMNAANPVSIAISGYDDNTLVDQCTLWSAVSPHNCKLYELRLMYNSMHTTVPPDASMAHIALVASTPTSTGWIRGTPVKLTGWNDSSTPALVATLTGDVTVSQISYMLVTNKVDTYDSYFMPIAASGSSDFVAMYCSHPTIRTVAPSFIESFRCLQFTSSGYIQPTSYTLSNFARDFSPIRFSIFSTSILSGSTTWTFSPSSASGKFGLNFNDGYSPLGSFFKSRNSYKQNSRTGIIDVTTNDSYNGLRFVVKNIAPYVNYVMGYDNSDILVTIQDSANGNKIYSSDTAVSNVSAMYIETDFGVFILTVQGGLYYINA